MGLVYSAIYAYFKVRSTHYTIYKTTNGFGLGLGLGQILEFPLACYSR